MIWWSSAVNICSFQALTRRRGARATTPLFGLDEALPASTSEIPAQGAASAGRDASVPLVDAQVSAPDAEIPVRCLSFIFCHPFHSLCSINSRRQPRPDLVSNADSEQIQRRLMRVTIPSLQLSRQKPEMQKR